MARFKRFACILPLSMLLLGGGFLVQIKGQTPASASRATGETPIEATRVKIPCSLLFGRTDHAVFQSGEELKELIAKYQGKECEAGISNIDFSKCTLLAVRFTSGRCHEPLDLTYKIYKDEASNKYRFEVRFAKTNQLCRALVFHEVWLQVPKLPDDAKVDFDVKQVGEADD
jgi:hypothetical protein